MSTLNDKIQEILNDDCNGFFNKSATEIEKLIIQEKIDLLNKIAQTDLHNNFALYEEITDLQTQLNNLK